MSSVGRILTEPLIVPTDFLGPTLSLIFTFVIPLGFVVTVPVKELLNKISPSFVFYSLVFAGVSVYLSSLCWRLSLRKYTSLSG
ncbi:MAG: hypothetical protein ACD_19C00053G0002 [uncultured bacterium]|nr:MAG: hypothetical protein ACD_19C00053G0002 [uncultured bacterium]